MRELAVAYNKVFAFATRSFLALQVKSQKRKGDVHLSHVVVAHLGLVV